MILAVTTITHPGSLALAGGSGCFGTVVGYITYRTLARTTDKAAITDLASVIGAIGGGAITALYGPADGSLFPPCTASASSWAWPCICSPP